jgi:DNA-binding XRE family transcriptional regulator
MTVQIIRSANGKPEWAVLPYQEYLRIIEQTEMLEDIREYDQIKNAIEAGNEELIPAEVVYAILDGANPVRVWREFRGLTQQEVAAKAGISTAYLSQLETGKRAGTPRVLSAIARVLNVDVDDLLSQAEEEDEAL